MNGSEFLIISIGDEKVRKHLLQLAAENNWRVDGADFSDGLDWLYLNKLEGTAGTAHPNSFLVAQGGHITLEQFISIVQNPPPRVFKPDAIKLYFGTVGSGKVEAEVRRDGWIYFRWPNTHLQYALLPGDAKELVTAYQQLNS